MNVILIDGKNAMFRYGMVHRHLSNSSGEKTGAIFGVLDCMVRLKKKFPGSKFVMVWDSAGASAGDNWRKRLFPGYKGNRKSGGEMPIEVREVLGQIEPVRIVMDLLGVPQATVPGVEADDLIGILSRRCVKNKWSPIVYSSDQDFLQLLCHGVRVISTATNIELSDELVIKKYRCTPDVLLKVRAICGDKSDCIPGAMPGVGPVKAVKLIEAGFDPATSKAMPQGYQQYAVNLAAVRRNYLLMRLVRSCKSKVFSDLERGMLVAVIKKVMLQLQSDAEQVSYSNLLEFLQKYELAKATADRQELLRLQSVPQVKKV